MKRITAVFLSLVFMVALCSCGVKYTNIMTLNLETATVKIGKTHTDFEGVNIKIKNVIWDETQVKLEVDWINGTKYKVTYGNPYAIEMKRGGKWINRQKIDNLAFTLPAILLRSGKTQEKVYDLTETFDITENGTYRFTTDCYVYENGEDNKGTKCSLWAEFNVERKSSGTPSLVNFKSQYIRTGSKVDIDNYPFFTVLQSGEELNAYYESNKAKFDLERRSDVASDSTIGFLDACDKYNEEFFNKNALALIVLEEGSGSTRHKVNSVKTDIDRKLYVDISTIIPEIGTCDMAQWHVIIEIPKEKIPKSSSDVAIYLDDELIVGKVWQQNQPVDDTGSVGDPVDGYCGNTMTTVYFDDGKSLTFMSGNSVIMTDILRKLDYDPQKFCNCLPEYKVDTEFGNGYGINLTEGYARCDKGQAELTPEQTEKLKEIIMWAKAKAEDSSQNKNYPDYSFSLTWGTYGYSSYDSETGELIKSKDATNPEEYTTELKLSEEEYSAIWGLIKDLDIETYPDEYNPHGNGVSTPYMTLILSVKADGLDKTVTVKETVLSYETANKKGQKFLDVCKGIRDILTATKEWEALPEYEFLYD